MKERPRVLVLDNSVATTGAFRSAIAMAQALHAHADALFVLPQAPALHSELLSLGFRSHVLPMVEIGRSIRRLVAYVPMLIVNGLRLRSMLTRERIDALIANDYYNLLPAMVRLMGWQGRIITVVRLLPAAQQPLLNRLWTAAMRFASNRVIAVSQAVNVQLPNEARSEVLYFPVGRGLEGIAYVPPLVEDRASPLTFLYLANYIQGKGQMHALHAFTKIMEARPTVRLRFVGSDMGLVKNATYRDALLSEAERLGLEGRVEFRGPVEDVVNVIQGADIVLNFSESESFSHTCVEAGLLGRPVIATRCGGPEEVIEDGTTGLLVPCGDVELMGKAMDRLIGDPLLCKAMGLSAWERTRARFGEAGFASKMMRVITA